MALIGSFASYTYGIATVPRDHTIETPSNSPFRAQNLSSCSSIASAQCSRVCCADQFYLSDLDLRGSSFKNLVVDRSEDKLRPRLQVFTRDKSHPLLCGLSKLPCTQHPLVHSVDHCVGRWVAKVHRASAQGPDGELQKVGTVAAAAVAAAE